MEKERQPTLVSFPFGRNGGFFLFYHFPFRSGMGRKQVVAVMTHALFSANEGAAEQDWNFFQTLYSPSRVRFRDQFRFISDARLF